MNVLWITWETQRRNRELAAAFGAVLKEFDNSRKAPLRRYFQSSRQTIAALRTRPDVVFCQCPSLVLCLLLAFLKLFYGYVLVVDAHNAIIRYLYQSGIFVSSLTKFVITKTDFIILSNIGLFSSISCADEKKLALPDKLPQISSALGKPKLFSDSVPNIVCICSYAVDEPLYEILQAAKKLNQDAKFFVTGKKSKANSLLLSFASEHIIFTDYLSERDYDAHIKHADITIDLTLFDNLLVCGAYETLSVGVPGILSDTQILRETFSQGYIFTRCDAESIEKAFREAISQKDTLKSEILAFQDIFHRRWAESFEQCRVRVFNHREDDHRDIEK